MSAPAYSVQKTYSGSTLVQIFDNTPKVVRPQMPYSFMPGTMNNDNFSGTQMPSTGGRKDFRFYTVRATRIGNPINITIEPQNHISNGLPPSQISNGINSNNYISNSHNFDNFNITNNNASTPEVDEYQTNGYSPFPPTTPQEIYRPVSYTSNKYSQNNAFFNNGYLRGDDTGSNLSDSSSSSSSSSEDSENKNIFHYLEFAFVSMLVNPVFGIAAVILSCSSINKAKKKLYGEARVEARFSLLVGGVGIGITVLTVVLVVLYVRTSLLCNDC